MYVIVCHAQHNYFWLVIYNYLNNFNFVLHSISQQTIELNVNINFIKQEKHLLKVACIYLSAQIMIVLHHLWRFKTNKKLGETNKIEI